LSFDHVIAQPAAVRTLRRALEEERLASAYLFEGPSGVGKELAAVALGQAMLCPRSPNRGCGECDVCRRVAAETHPDVRLFRPREEGHRNIQVEYLRSEILPITQFAPFEGRAALMIFPDADVSFPDTHQEAANAILKTLEEPRARVHFALLAERPDRLLPTILSRCQRIRFGRLPRPVIERVLAEQSVPEARRSAAVALADGRADRALRIAQGDGESSILDFAIAIDRATQRRRPGTMMELAEKLARNDDPALTLETLAVFYRDVALAGLGAPSDTFAFQAQIDEVRARATSLGPAEAARRVDRIRATLALFETNAQRELSLDALLLSLAAA
jgi:DNA polymerase-3 subunit delta'